MSNLLQEGSYKDSVERECPRHVGRENKARVGNILCRLVWAEGGGGPPAGEDTK